ncbi:MAG: VOC family protein [Bacteroidales bacterium]|nr:VOC family protein [Bacteroidales bacterium]
MVIDHICFAVKDLTEGIHYWTSIFGYRQMTNLIENSRQQVIVVFLKKDNSLTIKLIQPTGQNSSLQKFIEQGGGFHHICFKCDDMTQKIDELKQKGVRLLVPPQPGEAFENHDIAFFWGKNKMNFELIDTDIKAQLI